MPSPLNIPKTYPTDPAELKRTLERMAQEIDAYLRGLANTTLPVPALSVLNPASLAFGQVARVSVPDGTTLVMKLPQPDPANIGKRCGVRRSSQTGQVLIYAVGCLVAGQERFRLINEIGVTEFLFDGDYFPSRAGGGY